VFGRVVHAAVSEAMLTAGHPDVHKLRPLTRMGKDEWGTLGEVLELSRISVQEWDEGRRR
jgi:hypothetical protein